MFKLLQVVGYINSNKEIMVVDTGAACSVISARLVKKLGIEISKEKQKIRVADGRESIVPVTESTLITEHGVLAEVKLVIVDIDYDEKPILIGLDWLEETREVVDVELKEIKF